MPSTLHSKNNLASGVVKWISAKTHPVLPNNTNKPLNKLSVDYLKVEDDP